MNHDPQATPSHDSSSAAPEASAFPVVGVALGAGGPAAAAVLTQHLGGAPGVALVLVHDLDAAAHIGMIEQLTSVTSLPVVPASAGIPVEVDHVYVATPQVALKIANGVLQEDAQPAGQQGHRIDGFLCALAADRGARCVAVVLSGAGDDAAAGVCAIKAAAGVTFAQDDSAEQRAMPDGARATGCIDYTLAPQAIARELVRLRAKPSPAQLQSDDSADFVRILASLRAATGIDFANYKHTTLRRRVRRRRVARGLSDLREYAELLERSPEELGALCEEVLIHVTSFFRDPELFEVLAQQVFPKLVERRPHEAGIRAWVPGCSTGEEVYSMAISLLEYLAATDAADLPVKVFGTDVSVHAIEKARAGIYAAQIERDVSPERLRRFFTKQGEVYQVNKEVRDCCVFAKQDVTRDPPFPGLDLISCRNLMIYLGPALQDRILPVLHYALREPGFLVLGPSETTRSFPGFALIDPKNKVYARTSAASPTALDFGAPPHAQPPVVHAVAPAPSTGPIDVSREADRLVLAAFAPPGVIVTDDLAIVQFRGKTGPYLEPAPGIASFNLLRMVREELRLPLRQTVDEARAAQRSVSRSAVLASESGLVPRRIELEVIPFGVASTQQRFFVVLFKDESEAAKEHAPLVTASSVPLAQELASTRDYLQSVIEQLEASNEELKAANEEVVSSNEELRSTNEELQMAKEELQSTNEELRTVNDQMTAQNREAALVADDLRNVLTSVDIPIVILGRDSRIRRFTPAAEKALQLSRADLGKPVRWLSERLGVGDLAALIAGVLDELTAVSRMVQDARGHFHQLSVRPYLSADNRIDGTVLTFVDVDEIKRNEQLADDARKYAQSIVNTVRECLVVLDRDLRVRSVNRAFCQTFKVEPGEVTGHYFYELGRGEWDIPLLRSRLSELAEGDTFEDLRVEHAFERAGNRTFVLNARRIEQTAWLLLACEDITERQRAREAVALTELRFREVLTSALEPILMSNANGEIAFSNRAAARVFGYEPSQLLGLSIDQLVPERLRAAHAQHRAAYLADPRARPMGRDRELVGLRKDGSEFPIEVILSSVPTEAGPLVVCFVEDVTQRRKSEQQIREYQDKLQQMAFDAAIAEERERRRIAADLHDHIAQALALTQMKLTSVREAMDAAANEGTAKTLDEAIELVTHSIADTRNLTFELSPPVLYDLGLKDALAWLAEDVEKRYGIQTRLQDDDQPKPLDDATAALVFRAVRELLLNVIKHAKTPTAELSLRRSDDEYMIEVQDRGVGFDPQELQRGAEGFGLFSVREQIGRLGGSVKISSVPRQGTRVCLRVPLKGANASR